jgi:hypothetical protein
MSAAPRSGAGQWITPEPISDGSDVWSGEQYSSTRGPGRGSEGIAVPFDFDDLDAYSRPPAAARGRFAYAASSVTYPYYANYPGSSIPTTALPPYWPQPSGAPKPLERFAIVSLVLALVAGALGFVPLHNLAIAGSAVIVVAGASIAYGVAALGRLRIYNRTGSGFAIAGIALSTVVVALAVIGLVFSSVFFRWDHSASRAANGAVTARSSVSPFDLRVGDCVQLPTELTTVSSVTTLPCDQLHNGQVYAALKVTDSAYPGSVELKSAGLSACQNALPGFLGANSSNLHVVTIVPDPVTWGAGDRTDTCVAVDRQEQIVGDIRAHA